MRLSSGRFGLPVLACFLISACGWTSSVPDNESNYVEDNTNEDPEDAERQRNAVGLQRRRRR